MPKRKTASTKKTKTSAPVKNENESSKAEWIEKILREYRVEVKSALSDIKKNKKSTAVDISKYFDVCLAFIPKELRHLTLKEFAELGGTFSAANAALASKREEKTVVSKKTGRAALMAEVLAISSSNDSEKEEAKEEIAELSTVQTAIKGRARRPRRMRTPAITPKFDPDSTTPENIRQQAPGETTVFMSLAGTPLRNTVRKEPITDTLKECGLSPGKIQKVLNSLSSTLNFK